MMEEEVKVETAPPEATPAAAPAEPAPPREPASSALADAVQFLASTIVIAIFVIVFLAQAFQIPSESMEETLLVGDYLLVDKVHYGEGGLWGKVLPYDGVRRGDIIVFKWPIKPGNHFVKRVIGLPGDRVRMLRGRVFVNGQPLHEPYADFRAHGHDFYRDDFPNVRYRSQQVSDAWWDEFPGFIRNGELVVPTGHYFVLGDNRDQSLDSRYWGFVPRENIVGKPFLIYLSLEPPAPEAMAARTNDKMERFGYVLVNLTGLARWNRMMRVVP